MTVIIFSIMLTYSTIKFVQLTEKHNPNISQFMEKFHHDYNTQMDLNEINFRLAFSVEGYHTRKIKDDERYVKYLVRIYGKKNGREYDYLINYHKCKVEDWNKFPPTAKSQSEVVNRIKEDGERGMYCLDYESDDLVIYGDETNSNFQRLEILLLPCNYLHKDETNVQIRD